MKLELVKDVENEALYVDEILVAVGTMITVRDVLGAVKDYGFEVAILELEDTWRSGAGFQFPLDLEEVKAREDIEAF